MTGILFFNFASSEPLRQQQWPQRLWSLIYGELWASFIASTPVYNAASTISQFKGASQSARFRRHTQKTQAMPLHQQMAANKFCFKFNRARCENKKCPFAYKCAQCGETDHGSSKCKKGNLSV